MEFPEV